MNDGAPHHASRDDDERTEGDVEGDVGDAEASAGDGTSSAMATMAGNANPSVLSEGASEEKGEHARLASFVGAMAIGDLVKSTLGPKGMDKILQSVQKGNDVTVTNDGATILKSIYVDNPAAKVLVDISKDALQAETEFSWPTEINLPGYHPTTRPHSKQIREAARAILSARQPVLYVGGGVIRGGATAALEHDSRNIAHTQSGCYGTANGCPTLCPAAGDKTQ